MTNYIVLRSVSGSTWEIVGTASATGPGSAIRAVVSERKPEDGQSNNGTFVAVPARSWRPVSVEAVPTVVLKLGAPSDA